MDTAIAPQVCRSCGNRVLPDGKFCLFCGDVLVHFEKMSVPKRTAYQPIVEAVDDPPIATEYAGFWLRVWAGLIDVTLEVTVTALLTVIVGFGLYWVGRSQGTAPEAMKYVTGFVSIPLLTVGAWLYCAIAESSRWQATLGKRLMGLQVTTSDGERISFGQASVRHFMKFLSLFTLTVGFMMAGWTKRRQALHDMPSDCLVVRCPEEPFSLFRR
jgi:uncharacterized RDD family membrane protein YckC